MDAGIETHHPFRLAEGLRFRDCQICWNCAFLGSDGPVEAKPIDRARAILRDAGLTSK